MKERFELLVRCGQGGQESPCIFTYYFDYVLKVAACETNKQFPDGWSIEFDFNIPHFWTNREHRKSGRLNGVQIVRWLLYADDLALFCKSIAEVKTIMNILNGTCSRFGLTISFPKTKTQVFNNDELANLNSLFSSGHNEVENVSESIYLGQTFRNKTQGIFQWRIGGEGSGGPGPPLTFRPNWGLGRTKKIFLETGPSLN